MYLSISNISTPLQEMATHIKYDVSHFLAKIVDEVCQCGYQRTMIDQEGISCHTDTSMVVYRYAHLVI